MSDQITNNPEALRLFFTEDIFMVEAAEVPAPKLLTKSDPPAEPERQATVAPVMPVAEAIPQAPQFKFVGNNERNILILVNDEHNPVSTLQGRELLGNILKAINLSRNDCALVNYASCNAADFRQFQSFFKPQYVFAFGVSPEQLGLADAACNNIVTQDQSKLIFSSNLDVLSGDAATKKLLWASLKQIKL